MVYIMYIVA